jgi:Uma2 family endonuclease
MADTSSWTGNLCSPDDDSMEADKPALVMEILSATTRGFDRNDKLDEYKTVPTMEYILLVDPGARGSGFKSIP